MLLDYIKIRLANYNENIILTEISFASKKYWSYPEQYFHVWKNELVITSEYIKDNVVYIAETDKEIIGYLSIVNNPNDLWVKDVYVKKGYWLEHIFIRPEYIKHGVGKKLIDCAKHYCKENNIDCLNIFSDPYAKGFYDKIGATFKYDSKSSIEGRILPVFELYIN